MIYRYSIFMYLLQDLYLLWFPSRHLTPLGHSLMALHPSFCLHWHWTHWHRGRDDLGSDRCDHWRAIFNPVPQSCYFFVISNFQQGDWQNRLIKLLLVSQLKYQKCPQTESKPRNLEQQNHILSRDGTSPIAEQLAPRNLDSSVSRLNAACHFKWPHFTQHVSKWLQMAPNGSKWFHSLVNLNKSQYPERPIDDPDWSALIWFKVTQFNIILNTNASPLACRVR